MQKLFHYLVFFWVILIMVRYFLPKSLVNVRSSNSWSGNNRIFRHVTAITEIWTVFLILFVTPKFVGINWIPCDLQIINFLSITIDYANETKPVCLYWKVEQCRFIHITAMWYWQWMDGPQWHLTSNSFQMWKLNKTDLLFSVLIASWRSDSVSELCRPIGHNTQLHWCVTNAILRALVSVGTTLHCFVSLGIDVT